MTLFSRSPKSAADGEGSFEFNSFSLDKSGEGSPFKASTEEESVHSHSPQELQVQLNDGKPMIQLVRIAEGNSDFIGIQLHPFRFLMFS